MQRWLGLAGVVLWLAGSASAFLLMTWELRTERVEIPVSEDVTVHGTLYRAPIGSDWAARGIVRQNGRMPAVILVHGAAVTSQSCAPGLAVPLAANGYVVLAIDCLGHGSSGGSVPRSEFDGYTAKLDRLGEHPEIDAAIEFLKTQPLVAHRRIALVGHSRGGWAAANVGYRRDDIPCVAAIGAAPASFDQQRPRNFLMLTGGKEELCSLTDCLEVLAQATGGAANEPGTRFGDFRAGTARQVDVVTRVGHFMELADPAVTRRVSEWIAMSQHQDAGAIGGTRLIATVAAVLLASVGGLIASTCLLRSLTQSCWRAERRKPPGGRGERREPPGGWLRLALLLLLPPIVVAVTPPLARRVEILPVYFCPSAVVLLAAVGLLAGAVAVTQGNPLPQSELRWRSVGHGLVLAFAALALAALALGLPWGVTWTNLAPSPHRLVLGLALVPVLFPGCLMLSWAIGRIAGNPAPLRAGLTWTAIPVAMWLGHLFLAAGERPLWAIPVWYVAASFVAPLPLWLLGHRPGMSLARGTCHAAALAWLLACHCPFVHAG